MYFTTVKTKSAYMQDRMSTTGTCSVGLGRDASLPSRGAPKTAALEEVALSC